MLLCILCSVSHLWTPLPPSTFGSSTPVVRDGLLWEQVCCICTLMCGLFFNINTVSIGLIALWMWWWQHWFQFLVFVRCTIDWTKGKNVTLKTIKKKQKHKGRGTVRTVTKTVPNDSFFNFFTPPEGLHLDPIQPHSLYTLMSILSITRCSVLFQYRRAESWWVSWLWCRICWTDLVHFKTSDLFCFRD